MADRLMHALVAPVPAVDAPSWQAALEDAKSKLAGLAVRRAGAVRFRVTDHEVRTAFGGDAGDPAHAEPFAWSARTARRSIGVAAVRLLLGGGGALPARGRAVPAGGVLTLVRDGSSSVSQLDRWVDGLPPAGRAAVGAEAVTWATRLWCALDWSAVPCTAGRRPRPLVGQPPFRVARPARPRRRAHGHAHLVVLSGPRRDSVRAELALVTLVEALRLRGDGVPGRVVGWWPDSGHLVRVEPEPAVLTLGAEAVELALGGAGTSLRSAA